MRSLPSMAVATTAPILRSLRSMPRHLGTKFQQ